MQHSHEKISSSDRGAVAPGNTDLTPKERLKAKRKALENRIREKLAYKTDGTLRLRKCIKCRSQRPLSDFPLHATNRSGFASYCFTCKNALSKERRLRDPVARLKHYIVTRIKNELPKEAIPPDVQTNIHKYLGYKLPLLVKHLRKDIKEREGITLYESFKRGYHLDHIKPHSSFGIVNVDSVAFRDCWHYTNLRMISSTENLKKGAKII